MPHDDERLGRKGILLAFLGIVAAIFLPVIGFLLVVLLVLAWIFLVFLWIVSNAEVRRPVAYITIFTVSFIASLWVLGYFQIVIFQG